MRKRICAHCKQVDQQLNVPIGGSGGVGKTTFSAAAAYWLASQGKKVLVFSVDRQASLTDISKRDILGKGPAQIMDNLWVREIDANSHIRKYQQEIRQKTLDMYGLPAVPEEIERYIQAASVDPAADLREALDIDSMDFLNFVTAIHDHLGLDIPEIDYPKLVTLNGAVSYLTARQKLTKG